MRFVCMTKRLNPKLFFYKSESVLFNQSVVSMDPRWKHPFPALVAGPTCCGKSQFVKRLLVSGEDMIEGAPENIIWCYGIYQPAYDEIHGGYYMPARGYEFYLQVVNSISHK